MQCVELVNVGGARGVARQSAQQSPGVKLGGADGVEERKGSALGRVALRRLLEQAVEHELLVVCERRGPGAGADVGGDVVKARAHVCLLVSLRSRSRVTILARAFTRE